MTTQRPKPQLQQRILYGHSAPSPRPLHYQQPRGRHHWSSYNSSSTWRNQGSHRIKEDKRKKKEEDKRNSDGGKRKKKEEDKRNSDEDKRKKKEEDKRNRDDDKRKRQGGEKTMRGSWLSSNKSRLPRRQHLRLPQPPHPLHPADRPHRAHLFYNPTQPFKFFESGDRDGSTSRPSPTSRI